MKAMSLSGGFMKVNFLFPPVIAACGAILSYFINSPISLSLVEAMPVPVEKVPFFVAALMPIIVFVSGVVPIMALAAVAPAGYNNETPRQAKSPKALEPYPTIFRLQSAHNNTIESMGMMMPAFWVAHTLALEKVLFAKLSVLYLGCRLAFLVFYGINSDCLRTMAFLIGFFSLVTMGFAPLFPATVFPALGV
eukprot:CAMPEP_0119379976 /NCGR_PEP_ID=MMETSP1334-20130426/54966_1 /TAXON_ID=127549 /ORGANISM="Calcidiscus leptoporus, Strain RCC1130" /LENGTH=192 /DNA_ID=CAMNT_0007399637 /DNA_START=31 /DNA_END=609 /DNA_ORIENTATION=+